MKKLLTIFILFIYLGGVASAVSQDTSSTVFKDYLKTNMGLPSDMIVEDNAKNYVDGFIQNDKKWNEWKTMFVWWTWFQTSQSNCPYEEFTPKIIQDIQRMNRDLLTVILENYIEKSKSIPTISPEYRKWLQDHIDNMKNFKSYDLCDKIYQQISNYDYHLGDFVYSSDKEYGNGYRWIIAVQSVRQEYKKQSIAQLPFEFYSNTFSGNILVVSNKKDIKDIWKYKGIIFDERNRVWKSLRQTFYFPFSPLNNPQDYKLLITKNNMWSVSLYRWRCDIVNQNCVFPDEWYYTDINKYIDIKIQKEIWDIYFKKFNFSRKSGIVDYQKKWNYKMWESFSIQKINSIYFLASKEVKW